MSKTIVIVGFGPGISSAVADKFGAEGFSVALIARSADKLDAGVAALKAKGVNAAGFVGDAGNQASIQAAIGQARSALGPITVLHWNAYGGEAGDVLTADAAALSGIGNVAITGLVSAVQEVLPDVKAAKGAILVTNGAFSESNPQTDAYAIASGAMGLSIANAAKHRLVSLLSTKLKDDGVYVGQVTVAGVVKGTAWSPDSGIDPADIAAKFWALYQGRDQVFDRIA